MSMAKREFPIHMVVREGHAEVVKQGGVVGRSYVCTI